MSKIAKTSQYQFDNCNFFDQAKALLGDRIVYDNYMRCVKLFVLNYIHSEELLLITSKFLGKFPQQYKWMKDRLRNTKISKQNAIDQDDHHSSQSSNYRLLSVDIDESAVTRKYFPCKEELNDCWRSFPSWQSEDRLSSQKTVYEECVYRTEDERFELDTVIELNKHAIEIFENVAAQMSRMSEEEAKKFKLGEDLGAQSKLLQVRAIQRVYGDKASEIIESLMKNPLAVVPLVLKRLRMRELEWIEGRRALNEIWKEQELKALDETTHLRWNELKQNDNNLIHSKTFLNEIDVICDETSISKTTAYLPEAWYTFLRLYHLIAERLEELYHEIESIEQYGTLISLLKKMLARETDEQCFESSLMNLNRSIGWKFLNFEKIVVNCFRQLLSILNEEKCTKALKLYVDFYMKRGQFSRCDNEEEDPNDQVYYSEADELIKYGNFAEKFFGCQPYFKINFHHLDRILQFEIVWNRKRKASIRQPEECYNVSSKITKTCNDSRDRFLHPTKCHEVKQIFLKRNLNHCKTQLTQKAIFEDFFIDENLYATIDNGRRVNYVFQTYDIVIRRNRPTHANKQKNLWRTNRQRMYCFLKWYRRWLNDNVTSEQMETLDNLFTVGSAFLCNKKSNDCLVLRKISRRCFTRPFSYRRNFFVDVKKTEEMKSFIVDIDC